MGEALHRRTVLNFSTHGQPPWDIRSFACCPASISFTPLDWKRRPRLRALRPIQVSSSTSSFATPVLQRAQNNSS